MTALVFAALLALAGQSQPFSATYKDKYADVDFSWSSEAAAVPALVKRFHADLAKEKNKTVDCGKVESEARIRTGGDGLKCQSSTKITTSGQTPRLLSLARAFWAFTGGAHGNGATHALLWDRRLKKEIAFASLFVSNSAYENVLRTPYCRALDRERKKRRGGDGKVGGMFPEFDSCPNFSNLALIPAASRPGGKLDQIHVIAAPYLAGPFVEGEYDIALPVSRKLLEQMKPEYRNSFERQRQ